MTATVKPLRLPEVLERTGLTYRQLDYWVRKGWLRPENPTGGSGTSRVWPNAELDVAVTMRRLVDAGMRPSDAAPLVRGADLTGVLDQGVFQRLTEAGLDPLVAIEAARDVATGFPIVRRIAPGISVTIEEPT